MSNLSRPLDIVVYGATGFTGSLVCKHLQAHGNHLQLGVGGRSKAKLEKVIQEVGLKNPEVFVVDSKDAEGLKKMCLKTKVVITLVGPYGLYGEALIKACASTGTHYLDLTGETLWSSRIIQQVSRPALDTGAILIPSSGYDSIPSDLGAMLAVRELKKVGGEGVEVGKVVMGANFKGGASGGTLASALAMLDEGIEAVNGLRKNPYCLSPVKGQQKKGGGFLWREPGMWGGIFVMAMHNTAVVRRSWGILESTPEGQHKVDKWGPKFEYSEFQATSGPISAFLLSLAFTFISSLLLLPPVRTLVKKYGPQSGDGPTEEMQKTGFFKHCTFAHSVKDDVIVKVTLTGQGDPGYAWTSAAIAESALCLIENYDKLTSLAREGGPLTPATALGDTLIERLQKVGRLQIKTETIKDNGKKSQ